MALEYILFVLGLIVIVISLILSYKNKDSKQEDYYLQSEFLSEIREVKEKLNQRVNELEKDEFEEVFNSELKDHESTKELSNIIMEVDDKINKLEEKIDRLENKINYSLSKPNAPTKDQDQKQEVKSEHKAYQKISKLVEEGLSLSEVAQKLDMGTREVRLIWKFNSRGEE